MTRHQRLLIVLAATTALATPALAQTPAGWAPLWADEFNGTAVDTTRWNVLTRQDSYNNEQQYYTPNAVTVSGGTLNIKATKQALGNKQYQSGLIRTKVQQQFGKFEFRASLPATQGMWPALWLLPPDAVSWPTGGEIDVMENRGKSPTIVGSAFHYGTNAGSGHRYVSKDFSYSVNGTPVSFQNSMHTYGVEWDQARIRYLVDGVPSYTFYRNTAPISTTPMDIIINLALGGDFGGNVDGTTVFPQTLAVDYVRVYNRDNATRGLNNSSFENKAGALFQDWDEYSNGDGSNVITDETPSNAHSGTTAVKMYGKFNGATNTNGLYQEVPTVAGEVWQVGAFAKNRPGDKLAGGNNAKIKLEFINDQGAIISTSLVSVADANSPTEYRESVLRRTAPANAKFARATLEMQQLANAGGAVDFDDAVLKQWTGAALAGDINLDGTRDAADLDALQHSLAAVNTAFDFNGDSAVNAADVDSLLTSAFGTFRGDANLDHVVNFEDLVAIAQNYSAVGTGTWSKGDFNGDSNVNFNDLVQLAQNYGLGTAVGAEASAASFSADWAKAVAIAPEPGSAVMMLAATAGLVCRRRQALSTAL